MESDILIIVSTQQYVCTPLFIITKRVRTTLVFGLSLVQIVFFVYLNQNKPVLLKRVIESCLSFLNITFQIEEIKKKKLSILLYVHNIRKLLTALSKNQTS